MQYFYESKDGNWPIEGSTANDLRQLAASGQITPDTLIRREDWTEPRKASAFKDLEFSQSIPETVPEVLPVKDSRLVPWKLFAAIAGGLCATFLIAFILGRSSTGDDSTSSTLGETAAREPTPNEPAPSPPTVHEVAQEVSKWEGIGPLEEYPEKAVVKTVEMPGNCNIVAADFFEFLGDGVRASLEADYYTFNSPDIPPCVIFFYSTSPVVLAGSEDAIASLQRNAEYFLAACRFPESISNAVVKILNTTPLSGWSEVRASAVMEYWLTEEELRDMGTKIIESKDDIIEQGCVTGSDVPQIHFRLANGYVATLAFGYSDYPEHYDNDDELGVNDVWTLEVKKRQRPPADGWPIVTLD
jgi:hypothetical protein